MKTDLFTASQFIPTKWDTAEQKAKFANQFVKFVESDFSTKQFPKWFYVRLSNTFSHIAHYDQVGFYQTFFLSLRDKVDFLHQTLNWYMGGDPAFTYSDVEQEIQKWLREKNLLTIYKSKRDADIETAERALLARLSAKYKEQENS